MQVGWVPPKDDSTGEVTNSSAKQHFKDCEAHIAAVGDVMRGWVAFMCGLTMDNPPRWDRRNARWKGDLVMTFVKGLRGGIKASASDKSQYMKAFKHADAASQQADAAGTALALVRSRCADYQPPGKVQKPIPAGADTGFCELGDSPPKEEQPCKKARRGSDQYVATQELAPVPPRRAGPLVPPAGAAQGAHGLPPGRIERFATTRRTVHSNVGRAAEGKEPATPLTVLLE